jgi:hypothetical protein
MRPLLVEDDPELAAILTEGLREHGVELVQAPTFAAGQSLAALIAAVCFLVVAGSVDAQQVVTRTDAINSALSRGARLAIASADTAAARAQLITARALQNPVLATSYSKATPQIHVTLEMPVDLPGVRGSRIESAKASQRAAAFAFNSRERPSLSMPTRHSRVPRRRLRMRDFHGGMLPMRTASFTWPLHAATRETRASSMSSSQL